MKFGVVLPNRAPYCEKGLLTEAAINAEDVGFDVVLMWDHYMLPKSNETLESWLLLSYLASKTKIIRLGTCVTPIPFRPPSLVAKMLSTLDLLSDGRAILGVGAGWHRPEFDGFSEWAEPEIRVAKSEEGLELMIKLLTQDKVDFKGRFYSVLGAVVEPKPVQKPYPPMWFGTTGEQMLKLTAKYGSGWIPTGISTEEYATGVKKIREYCREFNREEKMVFAFAAQPQRENRSHERLIDEYEEAGCQYYAIVWLYPPEDFVTNIRRFGEEIIPSYK